MSTIWSVARQMIAEGVRMKIALVFLVLIGAVVLGLPFSVTGDGSLSGAVQNFLSYALTATGVLLGMLTIFVSRSLSDEFVNRHIFLVMTKPVARWQFIVGKWLGMTVLNAVFLGFAGVSIYGMVHYIRLTHPPIDEVYDKAKLDGEVLVARHARPCIVPRAAFAKRAELEFDRNIEEGAYENVPDFDPQRARHSLIKKYEARWRVVEPLGVREFKFDSVLCDRSPDQYVQIRYKTNVSYYPPDEIFRAWWSFGDPSKNTAVHDINVRHVINRYHTINVPADAVAADHTLLATFYNQNPNKNEPLYRNIIEFRAGDAPTLLFIVGSFEGNLFRLLVILQCKLMFLAAVAVLMTTVFSFPVACLTSFTVYVLAGMRSFLAEALDQARDEAIPMFDSAQEFAVATLTLIFHALQWVIPNFAYYDPVEDFVNGHNVGLVWVLQAVGELGILKTGIVLLAASLLFYRREVAELSV